MTKKKVYVVTSGEYSDYSIKAVFSTRKKANEYIQQFGTDCLIEEYDLDEEIKATRQLWKIVFAVKDGKLNEANIQDYNEEHLRDTCIVSTNWYNDYLIRFYVDADTMDRAIKIANERFVAIKANNYIWLRLTRPVVDKIGIESFERFNVRTNEFTKE